MSTNIHNGYRLAAGTDVLDLCERVRAVLDPVRDRLDAEALMERAVGLVDAADAAGRPRPRNPLAEASTQMRKDAREDDGSVLSDPHRFEVCLGRDPDTRDLLALVYTNRVEYTRLWEELPEVSGYAYWTGSDPDADVPEAEWEERAAAWERMVPRGSVPSQRMLTFSLRPRRDIGLAMLAARRPDARAEAARVSLLDSAAPRLTARARQVAVSVLLEVAAEIDPIEESDAPGGYRTVRRAAAFLMSRPDDEDSIVPVLDAAAAVLDPDVTGYVLAGRHEDPPVRATDRTSVLNAARAHLSTHGVPA